MTAELYEYEPPDAEDFVVSWMAELMRSAVERGTDDTLPFCVVTRIAGADEPDCGEDEAIIQLDIFAVGVQAAKQAANQAHSRMVYLARNQADVTMSDGSVANADSLTTILKPYRLPYDDEQIVRFVARYRVALSYVAV